MSARASDERTDAPGAAEPQPPPPPQQLQGGTWSQAEHDRYLEGLQLFPSGPWRDIADHVGTRSVRQVQTHAQKYHEKVARRMRGLRKERKKLLRPEHRIDDAMLSLCRELESERLSVASSQASADARSQSQQSQTRPRRSLQHERYARRSASDAELHETPSVERYAFFAHEHQQSHYQAKDDHGGVYSSAMASHQRSKSEVPSFHDCLDFLIDVFGSKEYSDATWYRQHHRRR